MVTQRGRDDAARGPLNDMLINSELTVVVRPHTETRLSPLPALGSGFMSKAIKEVERMYPGVDFSVATRDGTIVMRNKASKTIREGEIIGETPAPSRVSTFGNHHGGDRP